MMENNIKKKVIHLFAQTILILTFSVFLTSCAEEKQISDFEPPVQGIYFGISEEECRTTIGSDIKQLSSPDEKLSMLQAGKLQVFGFPAEATLQFNHKPELGLTSMNIQLAQYDEQKLLKKLEKRYGEGAPSPDDPEPILYRSSIIAELSSDMQERFLTVRGNLPEGTPGALGISKLIRDEALVCISYYDGTLKLDGGNLALFRIISDENQYRTLLQELKQ